MNNEIDIFKCLDYIRDHAPEYAQAKANRIYIEQYRKSQKALLINECNEKTAQARESYAYAHPEYIALLDNLKTAIELEERLKYMLIGAQAKVEIFRTLQANNRFLDKAAV